MKIINLGKVLKNAQDTITKKTPDHQTLINKNGTIMLSLFNDPVQGYALAKSVVEEFYLQEDDIFIIDNHGHLSSTGLAFDPDNSDEIALSIPCEDGEFPELKALEFSARFKEMIERYGSANSFNNFSKKLKYFLLFEGFHGHRVSYNTPLTLDFLKSKDFAGEYFEFYANFINETANPIFVKNDINFIKYLVGIILKQNIKLANLNELFELLDSFKQMASKLNTTPEEIEKFTSKVKARFTKYREFYFSGIEFSEDLLMKLSTFHNITSFYISKNYDVSYKELETLIILKKVLNLSVSNYKKEMLVVLDLVDLPNFLSMLTDNLDLISNYKNLNWLLIVDGAHIKSLPTLLSKAGVIYFSGIKDIPVLPYVASKDVIGEKSGETVQLISKRPEFTITKEITAMDIPKMQIPSEFYEITGIGRSGKFKHVFKLVVSSGPLNGKEILLTGSEIPFGRNELFPSNKMISRKHFKLVFEGENYFILDTSVNGTFLNGQRVTKTVLSDNDTIMLGNNEITILFKTN